MPLGDLKSRKESLGSKIFPLEKLQQGFSSSADRLGRMPVVRQVGITTTPRFTGKESPNPAIEGFRTPQRGDYTPWTPGFPPNPVPLIRASVDNQGLHLGWLKGIGNPHTPNVGPIPVGFPDKFRLPPPQAPIGFPAFKLGGFNNSINLHASVNPSDPMAYKAIRQVQTTVDHALNNRPAARGVYAAANNVVGLVVGKLNGTR